MRTLAMWMVGVVVLSAGTSQAQSLAEVAKEEKERRARLADEEPAPVIEEDELASSRGGGLSITGKAAAEPRGEAASAESESSVEGEGSRLTAREIRDLRQKWAEVWKRRLEKAEEEAELARDAVYQCNKASTFFFVPLAIDCDGVHERLAIAEYELKEIRANQYNWELLLPEPNSSSPES